MMCVMDKGHHLMVIDVVTALGVGRMGRMVRRMFALGLARIARIADGRLLLLALSSRLFVDLFDGAQLFLELHAAVLEPDFDLPFRQAEGVRYFDSPPSGQVVVEVELFLQFQSLVTRVRLPSSSSGTSIRS